MYKPPRRWLKDRKESLARLGWDPDEVTQEEWLRVMRLMYFTEGLSFTCMAERLQFTSVTLQNDFRRFGIQARPKGGNSCDTSGKAFRKIYHKVCECGTKFSTGQPGHNRCPQCVYEKYSLFKTGG